MPHDAQAVAANVVVRLVYLARLRDAFAMSGEALELAGTPTVATALDLLRARGGHWSDELAPGRAVRVAVNHDVVTPATLLRDGDEVALLPPVTGG